MKNWKKWLLLSLLSMLLLFGAWFGYAFYHFFNQSLPSMYGVWRVADMVIHYMESNEGKWPRNWQDLEDSFEVCSSQGGFATTLEELQRFVEIDFSAKPADLRKAQKARSDQPPFRVIYRRDGGSGHWSGHEPNGMILTYLQEPLKAAYYHFPKRLDPKEKSARKLLMKAGASFELAQDGHVVSVNLGNSRITDADADMLTSLTQLEKLNMGYSHVSDEVMKHVKTLKKLNEIYLYGTSVTDQGLQSLVDLPELETVILASHQFTDSGLEHIGKMKQLKVLNLNGTQVTDRGLAQLRDLKNLSEIMLATTKVTADGAKQLQQSMPNCKISR